MGPGPCSGVKICSRCRGRLPLAEFGVRRSAPDGLNQRCKQCNVAVATASRLAHPETHQRWEAENRETRNAQKRASRKCRESP